MGISTKTLLVLLGTVVCSAPASWAEKMPVYLSVKGQLTATLVFKDTQGGFAGFTGQTYTIQPDGSWTITRVFNEKLFKPHARGKLSDKQLRQLAELLAKNKIHALPRNIGSRAQANPLLMSLQYGKIHSTCALPAGLEDANRLPEGALKETAQRMLAIRKFLRSTILSSTTRRN